MDDLSQGKQLLAAFIAALLNDPDRAQLNVRELPAALRDLGKQIDLLGAQVKSSQEVVEALHAKKRALEKSAYTDSLTGCGNRAGFDNYTDELWSLGKPFTIAFADIDNLKYCNDRFGHAEGNRYISQVSRHLRMACADHDLVFRIGGDEFVLISPDSSEEALEDRLETCRQALIAITSGPSSPMVFSFSFGCSRTDPSAGDDRRQMTLDADRKMYGYKLAHCDNIPARPRARTAVPQGPAISDRVFQALAMTSTDRYFFVWNLDTRESQWSASCIHDFNLPSEHPFDPLPMWLDRVHPDDRDNVEAELNMVLFGGWHFHTMQYRVLSSSGEYATCDCKGYRLEAQGGEDSLYVGTILNRSAADSTDFVTGLGDAHSLITALGECRKNAGSTSCVVVKVNGIAEINAKYGYAAGDRALYETADIMLDVSRAGARVFRMRGTKFVAILEGAPRDEALALEREIRRSLADPMVFNGDKIVLPLVTTTVFYDRIDSQPYTIMSDLENHIERDYLTRNDDAALTEHAASQRDPFTGLYTGSAFLIQAQCRKDAEPDEHWCVMKIDLGHMRVFNEWYGKETGDLLLAQVATHLLQVEQSGAGVAGYWGQDDFSLFVPNKQIVIDSVFTGVRATVAAHDDSIGFLPAIGIYPVDADEDVSIDAYSRAVFAARKAKRDYKNRIRQFNPIEYRQREREYALLSDFQRAIADDEICFHLQPQVDSATGKIVGAEALARWFHADGTSVSPGDFIPVLESSGFIVTLDKLIWRSVFEWIKGRLVEGRTVVPVSVNVSRIDIQSFDVAQHLESLARFMDVPPQLVNVEITETSYAHDGQDVRDLTARLKRSGFSVYMDDFGSGLSSLSMLRSVQVDAIKMDQKFMPRDPGDDKGRDIVTSVIGMARRLNLPVIVEGVETEQQAKLLHELGDCYIQGFYYYRPMPVTDVEPLLDDPTKTAPTVPPR